MKKLMETEITLLGSDFYAIRTKYSLYDNTDYLMIGGLVIMS